MREKQDPVWTAIDVLTEIRTATSLIIYFPPPPPPAKSRAQNMIQQTYHTEIRRTQYIFAPNTSPQTVPFALYFERNTLTEVFRVFLSPSNRTKGGEGGIRRKSPPA